MRPLTRLTHPMASVGLHALERFAALFDGYEEAYGLYYLPRGKAAVRGQKVEGRGATKAGELPQSVIRGHLEGTGPGLGVIPLQRDYSVVFAAIDYDLYPVDFASIAASILRLKLPLVLCSSKSGGAHIYAFCQEPVAAGMMRDRLAEWTALLGLAEKTEQFPKQSSRTSRTDVGNWINLPYYNAENTERPCLDLETLQPLSFEAFLDYAESKRIPGELLEVSAFSAVSHLFDQGPPCLQVFESRGGFPQGQRNVGLGAVATYLKLREGEDWKRHMQKYAEQMCPGLSFAEIEVVIKSWEKKEYAYRCKLPPLNSACQRKLCLTRRYGISACHKGDASSIGVEITSIIKYEPTNPALSEDASWSLEVNGVQLQFSTTELMSPDHFNRKLLNSVSRVGTTYNRKAWMEFINELIRDVRIVPQPEGAGPAGQFIIAVEEFLQTAPRATTWAGLRNGMIVYEEDFVYFRSQDLHAYLRENYLRSPLHTEQWVYHTLRTALNCETVQVHREGKTFSVWKLPRPTDISPGPVPPTSMTQSEHF